LSPGGGFNRRFICVGRLIARRMRANGGHLERTCNARTEIQTLQQPESVDFAYAFVCGLVPKVSKGFGLESGGNQEAECSIQLVLSQLLNLRNSDDPTFPLCLEHKLVSRVSAVSPAFSHPYTRSGVGLKT
jgi:hypothetical protein